MSARPVGSDAQLSCGAMRLVAFDSPGIDALSACPIASATGRKRANNSVLDVERVPIGNFSMSVREVLFVNSDSTPTSLVNRNRHRRRAALPRGKALLSGYAQSVCIASRSLRDSPVLVISNLHRNFLSGGLR